jgi:uncharacterized protein (DUF486 family)
LKVLSWSTKCDRFAPGARFGGQSIGRPIRPFGRDVPSAPGDDDMAYLKTIAAATGLLVCSNIFMTFAWYAHLRNLQTRPLVVAVVISWGIAFFEYMLQVPANRIGYTVLQLSQLKILQEVITLTVFVPFAVVYMKQPIKLDFLWAGLCLMGAVYFVFRS